MKIKTAIRFVLILLIVGMVVYYFLPEKKLEKGQKVDFILVEKSKRKMSLYYKDNVVATYSVSLGARPPWIFQHPTGQKVMEGDHKTPEGIYTIDNKVSKHMYHRKLHISYPTPSQKAEAQKQGINPGGAILIHGLSPVNKFLGKFTKWIDWTQGCIALTNEEVEEVYEAVPRGCKIEIRP
jgi:murein L,D-transpeptidase YafK